MQTNNSDFLRTVIGMPESHARAFTYVAQSEWCVIISRAPGPTCHGLLSEGYDTKGFRIHGKSCNWGPMAGFVMRDPRLNKAGLGKAGFNRRQHQEALVNDSENQGWKADTTPLVISEKRRQWLAGKGSKIGLTMRISIEANGWEGTASHPSGIQFAYCLTRKSYDLWSVYLDNSKTQFRQEVAGNGNHRVQYYNPGRYGNRFESLLAMTNPPTHRLDAGENHLNAITGDYDLFAVWPLERNYNDMGDDRRPLGTTKGFTHAEIRNIADKERKFTLSEQGTKLGNITPRIYRVCQKINSVVGRNVLWHSDESARPGVQDVDLPLIAFTPASNVYGIESVADLKLFIKLCECSDIKVTLSKGWAQNPELKYPNRLGAEYAKYVPKDTARRIVPDWYNK